MSTPATLPQSLEIDGLLHVQHWRTQNHVVLQNYTSPVTPSQNPLVDRAPEIAGRNLFHVFRIVRSPNEQRGERLGTFTDLQAAMNFVAKQEQFA